MHNRFVALAFASAALFACGFSAPPPASHEGNGSSTSSDSTKDTDKEVAASATSGDAIDGTWDISAAGTGAIGPSEMTIKGGKITGVIVADGEGVGDASDCSLVSKDRTSFSITVSGDTLTGTFTQEVAWGGDCGEPISHVATLSATRAHAAKNANGATVVEGDWVIDGGNDAPDMSGVAFTVTGLAAKVWDANDRGGAPALTTLMQNGEASTTSANRALTFAARKR